MFYDIANFSGWLAIAFVVGGVCGWLTWSDAPRSGWFVGWVKWAAIIFVVGFLVATVKLLPGRFGLWLEIGLLMTFFYTVGCFAGGWFKGVLALGERPPVATPAPSPVVAPFVDFNAHMESYPGARPAYASASLGVDDLTEIDGIRALDAKFLNDLGIHRFGHIVAWNAANAAWIDHHLSSQGRVDREGWIAMATRLAAIAKPLASAGEAVPMRSAVDPARILSDPTTQSLRAAGLPARPDYVRERAEGAAIASENAARAAAEIAAKAEADRLASLKAEREKARREVAEAIKSGTSVLGASTENPASNPPLSLSSAKTTTQPIAGAMSATPSGFSPTVSLPASADAAVATGTAALGAGSSDAGARPPMEPARALSATVSPMGNAAAAGTGPATPQDIAASSAGAASAPADGDALDGTAALSGAPGVDTDAARPTGRAAPDGAADNLKLIKGIGPKNEKSLNALGVYHFAQIADWSAANARWVGAHMAFPGRIERERWIEQAKLLGAGMETAHSAAVKSGAVIIDERADAPMSEADAASFAANLPETLPKVDGEDGHSGARPLGLASARGAGADDLKLIKGIGNQNEARLHALGVWHFDQISGWSVENVKWVGSYLAFPGRIDRERWIEQARDLAAGRKTDFARRAGAGHVKSSADDGSHGQGNIAKVDPRR